MRNNKYRFLIMVLSGILLAILFKMFIFTDFSHHNPIYDFATTILITIILWETNLRIDAWLNKKYSWEKNAKLRFSIQLLVALIYNSGALFFLMYIYHCAICNGYNESDLLMKGSFLVGIFVTFFILSLEVGYQFYKNWKQSLLEVEKYKTESVNAQLHQLKSQINPHFLFNNLSVLSSLVYKNQDKAVDFINELSKVYRYVLENKNTELVTLQEELNFLEHYMYLLKIRFEESIQFTITMLDTDKQKLIPPMCLQMLIENAIKHNEVSMLNPLEIMISVELGKIKIYNKLQPRIEKEESNHTGLENIIRRYSFFTNEEVNIINNEKEFVVFLPLIEGV